MSDTMGKWDQDGVRDAILCADRQRCTAIAAQDASALGAVLSEDLQYLHSTGVLDDKVAYIATSVGGTPRTVTPGELCIRWYGTAAVVTTDYVIRVEPDDDNPNGHIVEASGMQLWVLEEETWRLLLHHGARKVAGTE